MTFGTKVDTLSKRRSDAMPRIAIVVYSLDVGGAERQAVLDANALIRRGFDVTLAAARSGPLETHLSAGVARVFLDRDGILRAAFALRPLLKRLATGRSLCIHAHSGWAEMAVALAAPRGSRLIYNEHGLARWRRWDHRAVFRLCAARAHWVLCASEATRRVRVEREGIPEEKAVVLYNSLSPEFEALARESAESPPPPFGIGFVGRFHPVKRVSWLVDLARRLASEGTPFRMLLLGDGPDRPAVLEGIEKYGLVDRVSCPGFTLDTRPSLKALHAFVLPSCTEGLSLALMEASCAGVPCVAFDVGGNGEIVRDGETGLLVREGEREGLYAAVRRLMAEEGLRRRLGRGAKDFALRTFSEESRVGRLLWAYGAVA